jgi:hypothetical protein
MEEEKLKSLKPLQGKINRQNIIKPDSISVKSDKILFTNF